MKTLSLAVIYPFFAFADQNTPMSVVGSWESTELVRDGPAAIIKVMRTAGEFGGTLELGGLTIDGKEDSRMEFAIWHGRLEGDAFTFEVKDSDDDIIRLELRLKENGEAELKFVAENDRPMDYAPRLRMKRPAAHTTRGGPWVDRG